MGFNRKVILLKLFLDYFRFQKPQNPSQSYNVHFGCVDSSDTLNTHFHHNVLVALSVDETITFLTIASDRTVRHHYYTYA